MSDTQPAPVSPEQAVALGKPSLEKLFVGIFALLMAAAGVALIALVDIPNEKAVMVAGFVGSAVTWGGSVVSYHFGSSSGSAAKDMQNTTLARMIGR